MTTKRGLGRGLNAFLGDVATSDITAPVARGLSQIAIDRIVPNPSQPRLTFDAAALDELRASIVEFGVLVPIIVRPIGEGFQLIAGERRLRAARAAQLETIPAIVRQSDERESLEVAIIENLQRENLDPLEEAMGLAHLIETHEYTQERVAQRLGRSRSAVANSLRLLTLSARIKSLLRTGVLTAGHARALLALPVDDRDAIARRIENDGMTVRAVEQLSRPGRSRTAVAGRRSTLSEAAPVPESGDRSELLERLRYRFATHVTLAERGSGGTIELRFADAGDLLRICDLLLDVPAER